MHYIQVKHFRLVWDGNKYLLDAAAISFFSSSSSSSSSKSISSSPSPSSALLAPVSTACTFASWGCSFTFPLLLEDETRLEDDLDSDFEVETIYIYIFHMLD